MNSSIDLNLLPLSLQGASLAAELPDLYAVTPPRRTARGREGDNLIIYLSMTGNSPLAAEAQSQFLEQLAHQFYKTSGSLTAALRTIVDTVNLYLLDRNLRSTSQGRQGIGQLLLVASRGDTLYMAQCGTVHAFVVTPKETQHLYDLQSSGRGLGFSRTAPIRFLQVKLSPGDYLLLATNASPNWSAASLRHTQTVEDMRSQLLETANQDFNAVVIQAQAGTGKLRMLRRKPEGATVPPPINAEPATSIAITETPTTPLKAIESPEEESLQGEIPAEIAAQEAVVDAKEPVETPETINESEAETAGVEAAEAVPSISTPPEPAGASQPVIPQAVSEPAIISAEATPEEILPVETAASLTEIPSSDFEGVENIPSERVSRPRRERPAPVPRPWTRYWSALGTKLAPVGAGVVSSLRSALATIGAALLRLLKNLLPDADVLRVPSSVMVFIAIAVPVILAVVGGTVFLQRGRAQQYQVYYQQASDQAAKADTLSDPTEVRQILQGVIQDLNKAEYYTVTSQSQELRAKVIAQLDTLDAVKRVDYKQAIYGGLDAAVKVTRMVATTTELYLLNGAQGNVLRAIMTGRGYEVDPNFQCGPTYGPVNVGPLVDIAELPAGSFENASILGMDANGNLLYCVVDGQPYSAGMAPPNSGFGEPTGMSLDRGDLFVLDPKMNAVWIYRNMEVSQQPHLFFGESVPPMQDVIDLAVYNYDLFLLHADGHITKCTYSGMIESPTRCEDPYPYSDNRPGRAHGPVIADAVFNQLYFSSFPERSIYMLNPQNGAIFYFSMQLTLQWQYQSKAALPANNATAFALSPNRMAFLAIGNNVYYAAIP